MGLLFMAANCHLSTNEGHRRVLNSVLFHNDNCVLEEHLTHGFIIGQLISKIASISIYVSVHSYIQCRLQLII